MVSSRAWSSASRWAWVRRTSARSRRAGSETRPFGLRYLTPVSAARADVLDLSEVSYGSGTQVSTIRGEPLIVAATKQHTNYATKTKEDRQEFEDVEEDTVTD